MNLLAELEYAGLTQRKAAVCLGLLLAVLLDGTGCAHFAHTRKSLKEGVVLFEGGQFEAAIPHLTSASDKHPKDRRLKNLLQTATKEAVSRRVQLALTSADQHKWDEATEHIAVAVKLDPTSPIISDARHRISHLRKRGELITGGPNRAEAHGEGINPDTDSLHEIDPFQYQAALSDRMTPPIPLTPTNDPISVNFEQVPLREILLHIAEVAGLNLIIDESVDSRFISIALADAQPARVIDHILATSGLFKVQLDQTTIIVAADTPETRQRFARSGLRGFYLKHADGKDLSKSLTSLIPDAHIVVDESLNLILVRGTPEQLDLAQRIVEASDIRAIEILVELEILEVNRSRLKELGVQFDPYDISLKLQGPLARGDGGGGITLEDIGPVTSGSVLATLPAASLRALQQDGSTRTIAAPKLRILNRGTARLHIGEKVPVKTATAVFRDSREEVNSFQYRDIGIVLELKPRVLGDQEIALDLTIEISSIVQQDEQGLPTIGTRELTTVLRLHDGESSLLAGLIRDEERNVRTTLPLFGDIPLIGRLFGRETKQVQETDIVMTLRPWLLGRPISTPRSDYDLWHGSASDTAGVHHQAPSASTPPPVSASEGDGVLPTDDKDTGTEMGGGGSSQQRITDGIGTSDSTVPGTDAEARVWISPSRSVVATEEKAVFDIEITGADNVSAAPFYLNFDPAVIHVLDITEGTFLNSGGVATTFLSSINNEDGQVIIGLSRIGTSEGASGSGTLISFSVQGIATGHTEISFSNASLRSPSAAPLPATFAGSEINVR